MPGTIAHQGATIKCPHAGTVVIVPATRAKLTGQAIAIASVYTVAGCAAANPPPLCTTGKWTSFSTRVKADGQPVVLLSSTSLSAPSGVPVVIAQTQTRVVGT